MRKNVAKIIEFAGFATVLVIVVLLLYNVLSWKDTNGDYMSTTKQLYSTEDNLIDVVFMGSSHCFCGISPAVLWEDSGIAAFDMSTSGQDFVSTYYLLTELLKTQTPKAVYIDLYGVCFEKHGVVANEYRNFLSMRTSKNSVDLVKEYFEGDDNESLRQDYYFRFPIVHTRYKELTKYDFETYEPSVYGRGAMYSWDVQPIQYNNGGDGITEITEISDRNKDIIDRLIKLSQENDFELEFIVIPCDRTVLDQKVINGCIEYAESKSIRCTDFNALRDEVGLENSYDYLDSNHLNSYGSRKLTQYIEYSLLNDYDLLDRRGDERYEYWNEDLEYYYHLSLQHELSGVENLKQFVNLVNNSTDEVVVLSLDGDYANNSDYFDDLSVLGMSEEEYLNGGKWIYADGNLTKVINNIEGEITTYDITPDKTMLIAYSGDFNPGNIVLDGIPCGHSGYYLTVLVYDKILDKLVLNAGF